MADITIHDDMDDMVIHVILEGRVTLGLIVEAFWRLVSLAAQRPYDGRRLLWDLRAADLSKLKRTDLRKLAFASRDHVMRLAVGSSNAIVVTDRPGVLTAQLWEIYGASLGDQHDRVFTKLEDAEVWLHAGAPAPHGRAVRRKSATLHHLFA